MNKVLNFYQSVEFVSKYEDCVKYHVSVGCLFYFSKKQRIIVFDLYNIFSFYTWMWLTCCPHYDIQQTIFSDIQPYILFFVNYASSVSTYNNQFYVFVILAVNRLLYSSTLL